MARYFAVNSLAGAKRSATAVVEITTAGRFDSSYVAAAISTPGGGVDFLEVGPPFMDASTSITGTLWTKFDVYTAVAFTSGFELAKWLNAGVVAYRIVNTNGGTNGFQMQYWNSGTSAWVNWGSSFSLNAATLYTVTVSLSINSAFNIYVGGTSVASSATVPTNGASAVTSLRLSSPNNSTASVFSQIMGADYDIRDAKLMAAAINGNSASNTGASSGTYTDVNETVLDDGTSEIITTVGNKMGQTHASITVPGGLGIAGMVVNARGRVSGGTITDGKLGCRSGSTNSSSSGKTYNGGYEPRGHIFTADPNGGGAWTQTNFNNAEPYIEAA